MTIIIGKSNLLRSFHDVKALWFFFFVMQLAPFSLYFCFKYKIDTAQPGFLLGCVRDCLRGIAGSCWNDCPQWDVLPKTVEHREKRLRWQMVFIVQLKPQHFKTGGLQSSAASPNQTIPHWLVWITLPPWRLCFSASHALLKYQQISSWPFHSSVQRCLPWVSNPHQFLSRLSFSYTPSRISWSGALF